MDSKRTASLHQFETSCDVEKRWAPVLDAWLGEHYELRVATPDQQWRGIDRIAWDRDGEHRIDYKCDEQWHKYGNVFLETVSNAQTGRPGWAMTSEADWLLYFLTPSTVLVCRMARIRAMLPRWRCAGYPVRSAKNQGYETFGLCVPVPVVSAVAEYDADPTFDAAILECRDDR